FYFDSFALLMLVLFFMGLQSAFFGPLKYSIIPQILPEEKLTEGTAYIELGTFIAILLGLIVGGLSTTHPAVTKMVGLGLVTVALLGYFFSRGVREVEVGQPDLVLQWNPVPSIKSLWNIISERVAVKNSVLAISWFWFFGAGILTVLPVFGKETLNSDQGVVTFFMALFTIGIAVGSIVCEKLSFERVEIGLVPIGSMGMTLFLLDIFWTSTHMVASSEVLGISQLLATDYGIRISIDLFLLSIFGGVFIVPLYTLIQQRSDPKSRSQVIAGNNVLNAFYMVVASIMIIGLYATGFEHPHVFLVLALMNAAVAIYIHFAVPEFTLRFVAWILSHFLYRLEVEGDKNIPHQGPVILACNHVSFIDWLILFGTVKRPARFVMYYKFFEIPILRGLFRQAKVIPIAGARENLDILKNAYEAMENELVEQEVICIFPEGEITKDGHLLPFKPGIAKMVEKTGATVVPLGLNGLWGSIFSKSPQRKFRRAPWSFWRKIELRIGTPISAENFSLDVLRGQVGDLLDERPKENQESKAD
ncbi:MAG: MFS transporter, partial [Bdellovibrionales bacterium]|nr:MFS transporter [Bdellovibrionales bacterium]